MRNLTSNSYCVHRILGDLLWIYNGITYRIDEFFPISKRSAKSANLTRIVARLGENLRFRTRNWNLGLLLRHGNRRRNRRRRQSCNPRSCYLHHLGSYLKCVSRQNHPFLFQLVISKNHNVQPFRYSLNRNLSASLFPVVPLASSQLIFAPLRSETLPSNTVSASAPL